MTDALAGLTRRAAELQLAFDRTFAEPIQFDDTARENILAIRVLGQAYAIRLSEITGLFADKKITPVPGAASALLGIAGFRGAIVPVYDLQALLGHSRSRTTRWLVIAAAEPIALAFELFDGQRRVSRDAILPEALRSQGRNYASECVRAPDFSGPILHLPSIVGAIRG